MPALFTSGFFDELVKRMNNDTDFKAKTASVTATVLMVNLDTKQSFLMSINKGAASYQPGTPETKADFTFLGESKVWESNHKGEAPMEKLVMTGKLKFKGSIPKIMGLKNQLAIIDRIAQSVPEN